MPTLSSPQGLTIEDMDEEGETEPEPRHRPSQTIREDFLKSLEVKAKDVRYFAALDLMVDYGCSLVAQVNIPTDTNSIQYNPLDQFLFSYCQHLQRLIHLDMFCEVNFDIDRHPLLSPSHHVPRVCG